MSESRRKEKAIPYGEYRATRLKRTARVVKYSLEIKQSAQKELDALDDAVFGRMDRKILTLADNPRTAGCKNLKGYKDHWRVRVGDWRVVYIIDDKAKLVTITRVAHRRGLRVNDDLSVPTPHPRAGLLCQQTFSGGLIVMSESRNSAAGISLAAGLPRPPSAAALGGISFLARPERVFGANDRVRVAICGIRGRGMDHVKAYSKIPNVEIAAICDIDENVAAERIATIEKMGIPKPKYVVDVRKVLEDKNIDAISIAVAESLARADGDLGMPGGQGRLRREAGHAQLVGRPAVNQGGATSTTGSCSTARKSVRRRRFAKASRKCMTATWARSTWLAACASSIATPSAAPRQSPCPPAFTTICGPDPRRCVLSRAIDSTTTGIGTSLMATATWAIRACTRSTWRAGRSGSDFPTRSPRSAATSCSTTIRTRRTH